ncbi:unnamed protein product [Prorocentrum cordatum]|uniref:Mediator of RNA polymerase II transcription subunit 7 n=1 Tax=Prorocentrum cordatum TaxID=2364126 RepID=A0ABN9PYM7_9DINO|nr:unnamed protein product [Polarella glacialis]
MGKLSDVKPSAQEVEAARKMIEDQKGLRSKMGCMVAWLKKNPSEDDDGASSSRGDDRKRFLVNFLALQMRDKKAKKERTVERQMTSEKQDNSLFFWWSLETMDKELGIEKSKAWRQSGKLLTRPDPLTGSNEDPLKEYRVPREMTRYAKGDKTDVRVGSTVEAANCDLDDLAALADGEPASSAKPEGGQVKIEPKSKAELTKEKVEEIKNNPQPILRKFQDFVTTTKCLINKAGDTKYAENLHDAMKKHLSSLNKVVKIIDQIVGGGEPESAGLKQLVETMAKLEKEQRDIEEWATKFGLIEKAVKRRRKS